MVTGVFVTMTTGLFVCDQVVKNNLNPSWKKFTVPLHTFCSGDLEKPLKVHPTSIRPSISPAPST